MVSRNKTLRGHGRFFSLFFIVSLFVWGVDGALAAWPEKQVDLVNPFGAGGAADIQARKLAEIISRDLGQPLVVRNVTGAGGAIAYNEVHRAKPDGHTLIWYSGAINTLAARKQVSFDYQAFEHIAGIGFETIAIAVKEPSRRAPCKMHPARNALPVSHLSASHLSASRSYTLMACVRASNLVYRLALRDIEISPICTIALCQIWVSIDINCNVKQWLFYSQCYTSGINSRTKDALSARSLHRNFGLAI